MKLKEALIIQKQVGKRLGEILVEQNFVTEEDIIEVLEKQLNIERVNLEIIRIDRRAIKMISENVCRKHLIVPYEIDDNTIKVAMADPLDIVAIDDVEISTGLNVRPYIAVKQSIQRAIDIYYSNQKVLSAAEELTKEVDEGNNLILDNIEEVDNLDNAPIIKMIEYVMKNAVEERASDIHIESYENILRIRYRIDGKLHTISTLPVDTLAPLVTRIKILANLDISEKRLPQDGRILTRFGDKQIDLRVSILPMITGEKIVIRIINKENFIISKEGLGIKDYELNLLEKITKHSNGIILVTGPTGSGKTTIGRAIIGLNDTSAGEIYYGGRKINGKNTHSEKSELLRKIQMIFQDPAASLNERATVDYIISEGLYNHHLFNSEEERQEKVKKIMHEVGLLAEHLTRYPHEFSGGQRQRIGIARALVMNPEFVIADEPISALDVSVRAQVLNLLKKFQREFGLTYLFIAHDLSVVRFISDRIAVIYKGVIVEVAETEELFNHPIHPYTQSLLSAVPIPDPILERKKVLKIYDPEQHDYSEDKPQMVEIKPGHYVWANKAEESKYRQAYK